METWVTVLEETMCLAGSGGVVCVAMSTLFVCPRTDESLLGP